MPALSKFLLQSRCVDVLEKPVGQGFVDFEECANDGVRQCHSRLRIVAGHAATVHEQKRGRAPFDCGRVFLLQRVAGCAPPYSSQGITKGFERWSGSQPLRILAQRCTNGSTCVRDVLALAARRSTSSLASFSFSLATSTEEPTMRRRHPAQGARHACALVPRFCASTGCAFVWALT